MICCAGGRYRIPSICPARRQGRSPGFAIGYTVRLLPLYRGWEEPLASEPKGVYMHDDGRPLLGRKLKGKSKREMGVFGLATDDTSPG
jgi:hypothetical protein